MECIRGFSFMSDSKVEMTDLQYIEGEELERTWKSTRRERMKQREQKIWEEFVKEKDVVNAVCDDDPYQFLEQLPQSCLKELMEVELQKIQDEVNQKESVKLVQEPTSEVQEEQANEDTPNDDQHTCVVTFADVVDSDDMFQIFDDKDDDNDDQECGPERLNDSVGSLDTVREKPAEDTQNTVTEEQNQVFSDDKASNSSSPTKTKSTEYVTNVIESSIYCAKVKDLRQAIIEEMQTMINTLDRREILLSDPEEVPRIIKRSAEFCSRFNRIYMYQITRQMYDVRRNNNLNLPFAKHTQFQSQMIRIVSLHQNILQSLQVLHKSWEQTRAVREGAGALAALVAALRDATELCRALSAPKDFTNAADMYTDDVLATCSKLDEAIAEYSMLSEEYLNSVENQALQSPPKKPAKTKNKKKSISSTSRSSKVGTNMDARLSMYSLDTLRTHTKAKDHGQPKRILQSGNNNKAENANESKKKSPRSRRPLMRDPHAGKPRQTPKRAPQDTEIQTLVENVESCASSHISRENSPESTAGATPRRTPRARPRDLALPAARCATRPKGNKGSPKRRKSAAGVGKLRPLSPVGKRVPISPRKSARKSPKIRKRSASPKNLETMMLPAASEAPEENSTIVEVTPVCKIQCAMKKDLEIDKVPEKKPEENSKTESESTQSPRRFEDRSTGTAKGREVKKPVSPASTCEVSRLLKQLCSGDSLVSERVKVTGTKNAQLYAFRSSPRQPTTPQLLRILEETIQKKIPKHLLKASPRHAERFCMPFNIPDRCVDSVFRYRTKFVQHMLTSPMYANSAVGKPWELISSMSDQIIDDILLHCVKDMEMQDVIEELYKRETTA